MNITKKSFTCDRDGLTIRGMQYFPESFDAGKRYPAVIASHGFLCSYTNMENWWILRKLAMWHFALVFAAAGVCPRTKL